MAVKDTSKKPYIVDRDDNVKVGIDFPFSVSGNGSGAVGFTSTTMEAVKNNIRNLLQTNPGERLMQPNLGVELRSVLFQPINDETLISIQNIILDSVEYWLPFVEIQDIQLLSSNTATDENKVVVKIIFNIKQDPNTTDSVTVDFASGISSDISTGTSVGGGGY